MGMTEMIPEITNMRHSPTEIFIEFTRLTSPGILSEFLIPFNLTMLKPVMANKESWDPRVLRTPMIKH
jgi:hypothetical protein